MPLPSVSTVASPLVSTPVVTQPQVATSLDTASSLSGTLTHVEPSKGSIIGASIGISAQGRSPPGKAWMTARTPAAVCPRLIKRSPLARKCYNCSEYGHKAKECKFQKVRCNRCNGIHKTENCFRAAHSTLPPLCLHTPAPLSSVSIGDRVSVRQQPSSENAHPSKSSYKRSPDNNVFVSTMYSKRIGSSIGVRTSLLNPPVYSNIRRIHTWVQPAVQTAAPAFTATDRSLRTAAPSIHASTLRIESAQSTSQSSAPSFDAQAHRICSRLPPDRAADPSSRPPLHTIKQHTVAASSIATKTSSSSVSTQRSSVIHKRATRRHPVQHRSTFRETVGLVLQPSNRRTLRSEPRVAALQNIWTCHRARTSMCAEGLTFVPFAETHAAARPLKPPWLVKSRAWNRRLF